MTEPDDYTRQKICSLSEKLLKASEVELGTFPTPLSVLETQLELNPTLDISELLEDATEPTGRLRSEIRRIKSSAKRILGATFHRSRQVVVDFSRRGPHVRWTQAHEFGHVLLPWHEGTADLDNKYTLSPETRHLREREAHLVANHLLYQGDRAMDFALDHEHGLAAAIALSEYTFTSIDASIRHYCESHPDPVALLRGRGRPNGNGYPILGIYASKAFTEEFGPATRYFPARQIPIRDQDPDWSWLHELVIASHIQNVPSTAIKLASLAGDPRKFIAEAFFNQYTHFVMLTAKRRRIARSVAVTTGVPQLAMPDDLKKR